MCMDVYDMYIYMDLWIDACACMYACLFFVVVGFSIPVIPRRTHRAIRIICCNDNTHRHTHTQTLIHTNT